MSDDDGVAVLEEEGVQYFEDENQLKEKLWRKSWKQLAAQLMI
ncbi:MAG: hypothetical protein ACQEP4_05370 [Bacillota bacterium]